MGIPFLIFHVGPSCYYMVSKGRKRGSNKENPKPVIGHSKIISEGYQRDSLALLVHPVGEVLP